MAGSSIGTLFRITTWGETHGEGLGVVVDGCPAGLSISQEEIQQFLNRRKPGQSKYTTPRKEDDQVEILSGVFEGKTTGTPISMAVYNKNQKSKDYSQIKDIYRPGHADYTYDAKYGIRDYRGGGRSSGRETIGRVAAGAVASKLLAEVGISITAYAKEIGGIAADAEKFHMEEMFQNPFYMPDKEAAARVQEYADQMMKEKDSMGGIIECVVEGLKPGIGDPVFEKLDAGLAKAILSIGAVKGFEIGDGFAAASSNGSANNDAYICRDGDFIKKTNHSGGVLGGISDGSPLVFRAAVKPTPSIAKVQTTAGKDGEEIELSVKGRHDPMIVPRAVVVVESMAAITIADSLLMNMSATMDSVKKIYE
ncbi:chorismate synthase [Anaerostipes sp.]|uniref:chorismate synthase n=1 Tax=Anaerostipes sp. TaxID=1872530 RepID=UPI0025B917B4|nr:chorismate synthase [Anaerostipes sp.]MBS7007581.1 chorismate synthase [Anaerostipes sp.]